MSDGVQYILNFVGGMTTQTRRTYIMYTRVDRAHVHKADSCKIRPQVNYQTYMRIDDTQRPMYNAHKA